MGVVLSGDGSQGKMQEELSPQSQSDPVVGSAALQTQSCRNLGIPAGDRETDRASLLQVAPGEVKVPGLEDWEDRGLAAMATSPQETHPLRSIHHGAFET